MNQIHAFALLMWAAGVGMGMLIFWLNRDGICREYRAQETPSIAIECRCSCDGETAVLEVIGDGVAADVEVAGDAGEV